MSEVACKYAVLRFMPYPETGEFANVGVLMIAPKLNKLVYRLETKQPRRITGFFNHLDKHVFTNSIRNLDKELAYLQGEVNHNNMAAIEGFELITRPRATILSFANDRAALVSNLEDGLTELFNDLVNHNFASHDNYEAKLQRRVKNFVDELKLPEPFSRHQFVKGNYSVRVDLTQAINGEPKKIIKPLYFDFADTKKTCEHASSWVGKFKRLKQFKLLPKDILFAFEAPNANTDQEIYNMITTDFKEYGDVYAASNKDAIRAFAEQ